MPMLKGPKGEFFIHRGGLAFAVQPGPGGLCCGLTIFLGAGAQATFEVEGSVATITKLLLDDDKTPGLSVLDTPRM